MPTVQEILLSKGNEIHTIRPEATVLDATKRMNQHKIGALVVMQEAEHYWTATASRSRILNDSWKRARRRRPETKRRRR